MKPLITRLIAALIILAVLGGVARLWISQQPIPHPPGVLIKSTPLQGNCGTGALPSVAGFEISKLATYRIDARVLGVKTYYRDLSNLVPIDVALGWGSMSDTAVLSKLSISQSNRFYFYEWKDKPPIPADEIVCHSANNHIIPADREVRAFIRSLNVGSLISLQGFLVSAHRGTVTWRSSLSRMDSGNGACELFYVTKAQLFDSNRELTGKDVESGTCAASPTNIQPDLAGWYAQLQSKRQSLNLKDPAAVKAFNLEAKRYTSAAHPERELPPAPPFSPIPPVVGAKDAPTPDNPVQSPALPPKPDPVRSESRAISAQPVGIIR